MSLHGGKNGGLLHLGGLRFLQFLAAVFRVFTNIDAVFRYCIILRFAEMDVFLTRFSALSYICSGFSVFEKHAVCGYPLPYCSTRFAGIHVLITFCANEMLRTINVARTNEQCAINIYQYPVIRWIHKVGTITIVFTVRLFEIEKIWRGLLQFRVWYHTFYCI
jgi:hypothetical protein